jgi:hypothetical protein
VSNRVTVEIKGFKRFAQDGVQVRVSETVELNVNMEPGAVTESVEIKSQTPLLDTTTPSLGQVIDQRPRAGTAHLVRQRERVDAARAGRGQRH